MEIINPNYKIVDEKDNIFTIREKEYGNLENQVREILKPTEELGFTLKEFGFKESKIISDEIKKTIKNKLCIKLEKDKSVIDISIDVPKLIDSNYIIINGRRKLPQFQLYDIPVITRGETIKLRTNVATIVLLMLKKQPCINITFLGKKIPLSILLLSYYNISELISLLKKYKSNQLLYKNLVKDIEEELKLITNSTLKQEDYIRRIGEVYSKYNTKSKGEGILYALDLIPKVDIITKKFLKTDSILEELLYVISNPNEYDDLNFLNKRIRCFEYLVLSKVTKSVFDLCLSNRTSKQPKFNVNSTQILSDCNVSNIVQFDFCINPIDELTALTRTSLVGLGGFTRENVPEHLRDINESMFGRICPVDTPDRDNCGVLQNLIPNAKLDENLKFKEESNEEPISIPVSLVPFLEHNDQTRLQMASSQMRQSIMLKQFDQPLIRSGCEGLYSEYTQFVKKAKNDGEVVHVDNDHLVVVYVDKKVDIFDIAFRNMYVENLDVLKVYVSKGDKFKKGDILAESVFCKDGKINIGKNLLTAVMIYYGKNYEDGIIISDRLVKSGALTSVHCVDLSFTLPANKVLLTLNNDFNNYKPLPHIFEMLDPRQPYAIMKDMPHDITDTLEIFKEEIPLTVKKQTKIMKVEIFANNWNDSIPEFNDWVESKIEEQRNEELKFENVLHDHFSDKEVKQIIRDRNLNKFSKIGKYKYKNELINGIRFEVHGTYIRSIQCGDKIGNRHGNKGVVSSIIEHEMMPKLSDGRHVDICINPLGIISRMNTGQLFELHLSMSLENLKKKLLSMLNEKTSQGDLKRYLLDYIHIIDNTKTGWYYKQFNREISKIEIDENFIKDLTIIQPPFESCSYEKLEEALDYTNTKFEYELFEPLSKKNILNTVSVGYMYFFRMVHIAESKLAARGIGSYTRRTLQPLSGRKNKGGQRMGEMEAACYVGHDCPINLHECLTTKSDCIDLKDKYITKEISSFAIESKKIEDDIDETPESVKLLDAYLKVIGVEKD